MAWLVTGGAGYIGAHVVSAMLEGGERVVVLDDLSSGDPARIPGVPLVRGSVLDRVLLDRVLAEHAVRGVVHIAAKKQVEESGGRPLHWPQRGKKAARGPRPPAAALLPRERRGPAAAAGGRDRRRRREPPLLLQRRRVRLAGRRPGHRGDRVPAGQPVRADQAGR